MSMAVIDDRARTGSMLRHLLRLVMAAFVVVAVAAPTAVPVLAQSPPAGLSQADFDRLVDAISKSVVERLKQEGAATPAPAKAPAAASGDTADMAAEAARFFDHAKVVVMAIPSFFREVGRIPGELSHDGRNLAVYFLLLAIAGLASVMAENVVRRATLTWRETLAAGAGPDGGPGALLRLAGIALIDVAALAAVWLVSYGAIGLWFPGSDPQARLASGILASVVSWRLYLFAFRLVLRPELPGARLAAMDDAGASLAFRQLSNAVIAVLVVRVVLRILIALKSPSEAISAGQLLANVVILLFFVGGARAAAAPVAGWLSSLARPGSLGAVLGRRWLTLAIPFFCILVAAQVYGAISLRFSIPMAMLYTLNSVMGFLLFETLLEAVTRRVGGAPVSDVPGVRPLPRFSDLLARCLRVAVIIFIVVSVAQRWIVDVLGFVDISRWNELALNSMRAGGTLFVAYVAWELVRYFTDRFVARSGGGGGAHDEDHAPTAATRLSTMMPLLRIALVIVIAVLAVLIVLSELGVNVTPLLAGASVFGLAISFGSQTLVRDIVSGVFYLADDAFRVGEYIDCGKAKGTVEGFTLRSIKLRHQNGQVHTIPFGQLGQITNFSRDWATMKFNLRFAKDTDIEKLRKAVKKIGQEMLEDPEIKPEIIEPLKMQGVADIADNALVVRFKFTVKPGKPTFVQRDAVKRLIRLLPAQGFAFSNAMVSVQTLGGPGDAAAGAAAQAAVARAQAEALPAGQPT
jgi:moderate conductance mechanosensitive channel